MTDTGSQMKKFLAVSSISACLLVHGCTIDLKPSDLRRGEISKVPPSTSAYRKVLPVEAVRPKIIVQVAKGQLLSAVRAGANISSKVTDCQSEEWFGVPFLGDQILSPLDSAEREKLIPLIQSSGEYVGIDIYVIDTKRNLPSTICAEFAGGTMTGTRIVGRISQ